MVLVCPVATVLVSVSSAKIPVTAMKLFSVLLAEPRSFWESLCRREVDSVRESLKSSSTCEHKVPIDYEILQLFISRAVLCCLT